MYWLPSTCTCNGSIYKWNAIIYLIWYIFILFLAWSFHMPNSPMSSCVFRKSCRHNQWKRDTQQMRESQSGCVKLQLLVYWYIHVYVLRDNILYEWLYLEISIILIYNYVKASNFYFVYIGTCMLQMMWQSLHEQHLIPSLNSFNLKFIHIFVIDLSIWNKNRKEINFKYCLLSPSYWYCYHILVRLSLGHSVDQASVVFSVIS